MRKCSIVQHVESDNEHSTKGLKEGGTTRICKAVKYNGCIVPTFCVFVKTEIVPIKKKDPYYQWCIYAVLENERKQLTATN